MVLLTVYFGESGGGLLHAFQRGAQAAFSPLEKRRQPRASSRCATWPAGPATSSTPRSENKELKKRGRSSCARQLAQAPDRRARRRRAARQLVGLSAGRRLRRTAPRS